MTGGGAEKVFVEINGVRQGMFIEGVETPRPVLLFVHGGPGRCRGTTRAMAPCTVHDPWAAAARGAATDDQEEARMKRNRALPDAFTRSPTDTVWTTTVTRPLPDCPSVEAAWERLAFQTRWPEWRSASEMRSAGVVATLVPPATEPLQAGDEYVVRVNGLMKIRCHVLESSAGGTPDTDGEMTFDAVGLTLGGLVKARFRFTVFAGEDGTVMARAQEKVEAPWLLAPNEQTLAEEHEHTFSDLNDSFLVPSP